jgi:hypothetical protein
VARQTEDPGTWSLPAVGLITGGPGGRGARCEAGRLRRPRQHRRSRRVNRDHSARSSSLTLRGPRGRTNVNHQMVLEAFQWIGRARGRGRHGPDCALPHATTGRAN